MHHQSYLSFKAIWIGPIFKTDTHVDQAQVKTDLLQYANIDLMVMISPLLFHAEEFFSESSNKS